MDNWFPKAVVVVLLVALLIVVFDDWSTAKGPFSGATPGATTAVVERLKTEEGFRGHPYVDTRGYGTIGYGTKLPITKAEAAWLLETRLVDTHARLAKAWEPYKGLNSARQGALLDMAYELGVDGLLKFHSTLAALERGDWAAASESALSSLWAREVPNRARAIAAILKNG